MSAMAAKIRRSSHARSSVASSEFNIDMVTDFDTALTQGINESMDVDAGAAPAAKAAENGQAVGAVPPEKRSSSKTGPDILMQGPMSKKGDGFGFLSRWQDR